VIKVVGMKTTLYLGTSPAHFAFEGHLIHYPIIKIVPKKIEEVKHAYDLLDHYTHLIFTSKNTVRVFCEHLDLLGISKEKLSQKWIIAIGKVTEMHLSLRGLSVDLVAEEETQEGVIEALKKQDLKNAHIFMPRSSQARPNLLQFFEESSIRYQVCDLYDTEVQIPGPLPNLETVDQIVFTSPSTVHAFKKIFGKVPPGKKLIPIGAITEAAIVQNLNPAL
jgi:uroporphyrinogen-III synthase